MNNLYTLQTLGLSEEEAKIYLAVLSLGKATMSEIARETGIKRPTCYLYVEQLFEDQLLYDMIIGKRRYILAAHPKRLEDKAQQRLEEIQDLTPQLTALFEAPKERPKIRVIEGRAGIEELYKELIAALCNKEEALWFARMDAVEHTFPEVIELYKNMLLKVDDPHIRELYVDNKEGQKWLKRSKKFRGKHHHIRLLPKGYNLGMTDNLIFQNKLVIISLEAKLFVTIIESKEVVQTYKTLFECAWLCGK